MAVRARQQFRRTRDPTRRCSLIASAKLNDVEPFAYLRDILQRMTEGHAMSRLDELLPWNWPKMRVNH
ncbi:MAG: hypothetical protein AUI16_03865 [Alphaproteobacteria bacterium 13_2_20CM_2_64_7]|nr:MAG: hypothetical protein AUI16_03865 [Alphaproteobacteria bacterium 13_2_20CM_2_64_7]